MLSDYNQIMSNKAKDISRIFDNLAIHGYRALSGIDLINNFYAITVHQNGTEIVHRNIPGFEHPMLETRPIIIAGGAGKIALSFTTTFETDSLTIAEVLRQRHASKEIIPIIQSAPHTGTIIHYRSKPSPLTSSYMRDRVQIDTGVNASNLDIEPVIREAVEVGGLCLVGYENSGFSQILLNSARSLNRLASES